MLKKINIRQENSIFLFKYNIKKVTIRTMYNLKDKNTSFFKQKCYRY